LFLLLLLSSGFAQSKADKKKIKSLSKDISAAISAGDYATVWTASRQLLVLSPSDENAGLSGAAASFKLNYPVDSLALLGQNLSVSAHADCKYYLARLKHRQHKTDEAVKLLDELQNVPLKSRTIPDAEIARIKNYCANAKNYVSKPHLSAIRNLGPNVNSRYDDYVPVPTPDETALYFTSKRAGSTGNQVNGDNKFFEDIYVSYKEKGSWKPAQNAGFPLNTETNDACVAISPDGHNMIIYRTSADGLSGDLYQSRLGKNDSWSKPVKMAGVINSEFIETSACFSNDSSEIFFSSDRPGGLGGKDIYRIKKVPDGHWSAPLNLGPSVNTALDDDSPYLHVDGVTLFFSSKGHSSMGEYDIFKSVWNKETNTFSDAENLGYPLNDVDNDIFFTMTADGKRGYYSSVKEKSLGGEDIYEIDTRFGDNDTYVKSGYAYLGTMPARIRIAVTEKETGTETGVYHSNPETGKFIILLNPMKAYTIMAEEDGYRTETFDIPAVVDERRDNTLRIILSREKINK
jgi:hypothetical protein